MVALLGGVFLGWSLGANDAANCFGSAVASRMVRFWTAACLCAACVVLGALLEGRAGIETLKDLTQIDLEQAVVITVAAAVTVTIMTLFELPVSTSQAAVGAILGIGFFNQEINVAGLGKVVACWFGTPIGAVAVCAVLYKLFAYVYNRLPVSVIRADILLRAALIVAGSYASYTLGANNVANTTAVFVGAGMLTVFQAALIGGLSIGSGVLTYSRKVMETVGSRLVRLDPFSALMVILAEGLTVHFFTVVGVPVSTSQAVVGAVLGVGLVRGANTIKRKTLYGIFTGWFLTPPVACFIAM
ncbi:MAG TPA: anion permease, partial [Desulfobacterales bacterium]|nr:anion permease [Desulfobacterales bacterium]